VFIFTVVLPKFPLMQFTGGSVSKGSELQIEVAEFLWKDVEVTIEVVVLPVLCPNVLI
jgi:UTP---glucose-1-phosphate uridylyltransferase